MTVQTKSSWQFNQSRFQTVNEKTLDHILWTGKGQNQTPPPPLQSPEHASAIAHLCCPSWNCSFQSRLSHKMTAQDWEEGSRLRYQVAKQMGFPILKLQHLRLSDCEAGEHLQYLGSLPQAKKKKHGRKEGKDWISFFFSFIVHQRLSFNKHFTAH